MKTRLGILISGGGSNMQSLAKATQAPNYPAEISLVISNRSDAKGIKAAQELGITTKLIEHQKFSSRKAFEQSLNMHLIQARVDLVCLAGFMRVLSPYFVQQWRGKLLNIHPSLLPKFRGLHTHEMALKANVKVHGCTVHEVADKVDSGPILGQAQVPVLPDDTPDSLAKRVLIAEHKLYPQIVQQFCLKLQNST